MSKKSIRIPTDKEISVILSKIRPPRDKLIFVFALKLGLRSTEIAHLKISDLNLDNKTISFIGKGNKPATLPLTDEVISYLENALKTRPTNLQHGFLIWNTRDKTRGITRFNIYYLIRKYGKSINLKIWPHLLRHKCGSDIMLKGDIYRAKEALRHSRISTTADIYAHLDMKNQREDFNKLDTRPWFIKFLSKFKSPIPDFLIEQPIPEFKETIGREKELQILKANEKSGISTIIVSDKGSGASHLLRKLTGNHIFYLDEIRPARERLIELAQQMKKQRTIQEVPKGKSTSIFLKSLISKIDDKHYTLVIDSISDIAKEGISLLRKLKEHFTIISSIDIKQRSKLKDIFFGSHDIIELKNLDNKDAYKLAEIASIDLPTTPENKELILKKIVAESKGSPKALIEITEKQKRRGKIIDASTEINNEAIQEPLPATPFLSAFLIVAVISRYGASTLGMPDWKIILIIVVVVIAFLILIDKILKQDN